jgi:putative ABC transport system permease protein
MTPTRVDAPPALVRHLLRWLTPSDLRETFVDDLDEAFANEVAQHGRRWASLWYCHQALAGIRVGLTIRRRHMLTRRKPEGQRMTAIDRIAQDVRHAVRLLFRSSGFTFAAVLTLALGIGANTAVFTVAWQAILKPLPYPNSDRLVNVWETILPRDTPNPVMPGNFHDWQREARSFDALAAYTYFGGTTTLTGGGDPAQLRVRYVTADYFRVFGMPPLLGRPLDKTDDTDDSNAVVISEVLWRDRFGRDPSVIGREVRLAERPRVVVGIMPSAFSVAGGPFDAWTILHVETDPPGTRLRAHYLGVVARLKPGITLKQATQDVKAIASRAAQLYPEANRDLSATVESIADARGVTLRAGLAILGWAAGAVLLMACSNLASLLLARGVAREREFGIRAALGAGRGRLLMQLLAESLVLSAIGAVAGLLLGWWLLTTMAAFAPVTVKNAASSGIDWVIVLYAIGLAVVAAFISAAAPAWRAAGGAVRQLGERGTTGDRRVTGLRTALVIGQVALAIVLLVGATLLVTSLVRLLRVDPGFDPEGVVAFDVSMPGARYDTYAKQERFLSQVMTEVLAVPGVTVACAINEIPFDALGGMTYVPEGEARLVGASPRNVTAGCFDILRLRIVRGRPFTDHETTRVGIVTEGFAKQAWPGQNPVGRRVHLGLPDGPFIEIVGVVNDSLQFSLEGRPYPQFYEVMSAQSAFPPQRVLVRAGVPPGSILAAIRAAVRHVDPNQPVANLRPLTAVVGASVSGRTFDLSVISAFSLIALVLAAIGIYGLLAQVVAQRTGEIGIRLALGATAASTVRLVMRNAWIAVGCGAPLGLLGAFEASQLIRRLVFHVSPTEPRVYLSATAALALVALCSAWLAARRAGQIDPIQAMRR